MDANLFSPYAVEVRSKKKPIGPEQRNENHPDSNEDE